MVLITVSANISGLVGTDTLITKLTQCLGTEAPWIGCLKGVRNQLDLLYDISQCCHTMVTLTHLYNMLLVYI